MKTKKKVPKKKPVQKTRNRKQIKPEAQKAPVGRPRAIETPECLHDLFEEYKQWCNDNPYLVHDFVGGFAREVNKKRRRPLTWVGFEGWLCANRIINHLGHYEQNKDGAYEEFLPIIRAIKAQCKADVIDGALGGIYNANLAARYEGVKDTQEVNLNDNRKAVADVFPLDEEREEE